MLQVRECWEYAQTCRSMANDATSDVHKAQFLRLADQWDTLAKARRALQKLNLKIQKSLMD